MSSDEWIMKLWYTYTMEYYSAITRKEIRSFVEDLESVTQSEVRKIKTHICGYTKTVQINLFVGTEMQT